MGVSRQRRRALLRGDYRALAVHTPWSMAVSQDSSGKCPLTEIVDGQSVPWTDGHSAARLDRVTPMSANTGVLLGGAEALVALDIDPAKGASESDQRAFALDTMRALRAAPLWAQLQCALMRLRDPASVLLLLRADRMMSKVRVEGQRGAVELLGDGQQVVVDGWHPVSLQGAPVRWRWPVSRAPWDVPAGALPVVAADALRALMQRIAVAGVLGAPRAHTMNQAGGAGQPRTQGYAATARLHGLFEKHDGLVKPAVRELVERIGAEGCGRHDALVAIAGRLVLQQWDDRQAVDFLVPLVNRHFGDGDWTDEVVATLAHARKRQAERSQNTRTVTWR